MVGDNEPTPPNVRRRQVRQPSLEAQLNTLRRSSTAELNALRRSSAAELNALRESSTAELNTLRGSLADVNALRESLEAELNTLRGSLAEVNTLRQSSAAVVVERDESRRQVAERELDLEKAQADVLARQKEVDTIIEVLDGLAASGHLTRPRERTLSGYMEIVAKQLVVNADAQKAAGQRITELEVQLATGERALRDGLEKIADLQGQIDTRVVEGGVRIAELEAALADAQKTILSTGTEDQQITQLIAENRRLADQLETMPRDLSAMREVAEEAKSGLDAALAETEARVRLELTRQINAVQGQRDSLQAQLNIVTKQLGDEGKPSLLPADKLAEMVGGLVDQIQGSLGGLRIREGDVKLKVGFGMVGDVGGFMIPSIDSPPELRENLQEITFRFDRTSG